ncbi:MAG: tetratricopeptide repeat protein [Patescibacteria group bacterium]
MPPYYFEKKQYDLAEKAILKAINLKPESSSYYFYAVILTRSGRYAESQQVINEYLEKRRQRADVKFLSAVNYWRLGDRNKAREFFDWSPTLSEAEKLYAIETY